MLYCNGGPERKFPFSGGGADAFRSCFDAMLAGSTLTERRQSWDIVRLIVPVLNVSVALRTRPSVVEWMAIVHSSAHFNGGTFDNGSAVLPNTSESIG